MSDSNEFRPGRIVRVNGGIHNGDEVMIVDPREQIRRAYASGKELKGNTNLNHNGCVAIYNPKFESTFWWWIAPHQIEEIKP